MTPGLLLAVALAGGVGAAARLVVDGVARSLVPARWPVGTALINVSGSLLLGVVTGLVLAGVLDPVWRAVLGTGVLGGFTTFSAFSLETANMLIRGQTILAVAYAVSSVAGSVMLLFIGLFLTRAIG